MAKLADISLYLYTAALAFYTFSIWYHKIPPDPCVILSAVVLEIIHFCTNKKGTDED